MERGEPALKLVVPGWRQKFGDEALPHRSKLVFIGHVSAERSGTLIG